METIIELYDEEPIKNILSTLIFKPSNLIYLVEKNELNNQEKEEIRELYRNKKLKTKVMFEEIDPMNPSAVASRLESITRKYKDIGIDLTGGNEIVLLSVGQLCKRKNIPGFYIDLNTKQLIVVYGRLDTIENFAIPKLLVEDILEVAGATIDRCDHFQPDLEKKEMIEEIRKVFEISMRYPKQWKKNIVYLQNITKRAEEGNKEILRIEAPSTIQLDKVYIRGETVILKALSEIGVIQNLKNEPGKICFKYKSKELKRCLVNHGIWLEMYIYILAKESNYFNDVRMSVVIDWDGDKEDFNVAFSEIDLILVKDLTAIFISCKVPLPDNFVLSEIKVLSQKFGGMMGKSVIVTASDLENKSTLYKRAKELDIIIIDEEDLRFGKPIEILEKVVENRYEYVE
ncbi:MAG: Card1-like endonuclease domain-containing protein [Eubacteriaceae bacterium]